MILALFVSLCPNVSSEHDKWSGSLKWNGAFQIVITGMEFSNYTHKYIKKTYINESFSNAKSIAKSRSNYDSLVKCNGGSQKLFF